MATRAWTYDTDTDIGRIRLLIQDNRGTDFNRGSDFLFSDDEILFYVGQASGNLRYAAADMLETMATNQIMLLKVLKMGILGFEGDKVAKTLMELADKYRQQADWEADASGINCGPADWASFGDECVYP